MPQQVASLYADIGAKTDGFTKGAATVLSGLGNIVANVSVLTTALTLAKAAFDMSKEGAQLQRLSDSGAEIARQFGGNMDLIVEKVKAASLGTVSEMDIISSANKAMMLGLGADADQLANLMEIAAFRGRAMGLSTTQAFDDIVRGVGRASPMILDNLGIVINAKETYAKYAEGIGKTAGELTKAEKTQALLNAVLDEGNTLLDKAGGLVEDNASQYEQLTARITDYRNNLKMTLTQGISPSIEAFLDMSDAMDEASEATGRTDQRSRIYLGAIQQQLNVLEEERQRLNDVQSARMNGIASIYDETFARKNLLPSIEDVTAANEEFLSVLGDVSNAEESYQEKTNKLTAERIELENEKILLLSQGYTNESSEIQSINEQLANNSAAAQSNADEHELANRRIILGLLERKLTADGILDDKELMWLLEKGRAWGIYSDTVISETQRAIDEANSIIDQLVTEKTFTLTLNTLYGQYGDAARIASTVTGGNRRAAGGPVSAGQTYLVGEQGMELFTPNQSGNITPNNKLGGVATSGGIVVQIMLDSATPDPERVAYQIAPAVKRVLREQKLI